MHDTLHLSSTPSAGQGTGLRGVVESKWLGGSLVAWSGVAASILAAAVAYGANQSKLDALTYQLERNRADTRSEVQGKIDSLAYQVQRNRDESLDRIKSAEHSISNVYTSLAAINRINTDVEVIKEQIKSINDTVRRIEKQGRATTAR